MKVEYVTLEYYPYSHNVEHINIGFFLHDIAHGSLFSEYIKKLRRWLEFDSRLNEEKAKLLQDYAKEIFSKTFDTTRENTVFGKNSLAELKGKDGYFDVVRRHFQNQLRLSQTITAEVEDPAEFFHQMLCLEMPFDYQPSRIRETQIRSLLLQKAKSILLADGSIVRSQQSFRASDDNETIQFDYCSGPCYVKVLNPATKDPNQFLDKLKAWVYNCQSYFGAAGGSVILYIPLSDECPADLQKHIKQIASRIPDYVAFDDASFQRKARGLMRA